MLDDRPHENCGVVGIFSMSGTNVVPMSIDALRALQHRGQEAWGIAVPNKKPLKRMGLVSGSSSDFKRLATEYSSPAVIGHVRYSTVGRRGTRERAAAKGKGSVRGPQWHHCKRTGDLKHGWRVHIYPTECN